MNEISIIFMAQLIEYKDNAYAIAAIDGAPSALFIPKVIMVEYHYPETVENPLGVVSKDQIFDVCRKVVNEGRASEEGVYLLTIGDFKKHVVKQEEK